MDAFKGLEKPTEISEVSNALCCFSDDAMSGVPSSSNRVIVKSKVKTVLDSYLKN